MRCALPFLLISTLAFLLISTLALPALADDDGIAIRPGEWRVTSQTSVSSAPNVQERETTACFEKDVLTADHLTRRSAMCNNQDVEVQDGIMIWKVICFGQMRGNSGIGRMEMREESFEGKLALYGIPRPNGDRIVVTTKWTGKRLGECKPAGDAAGSTAP